MNASEQDRAPSRCRIVVVPDLMGSELWDGGTQAWPSRPWLSEHGERLVQAPLTLGEGLPAVYAPLKQRLRELGPVSWMPWDWRQELEEQARLLASALRSWIDSGPAALPPRVVGHGFGGLLCWAALVGDPALADRLVQLDGRLVMLAPPWGGCARLASLRRGEGALHHVLAGRGVAGRGVDGRLLAASLPASSGLGALRALIERGWADWRAGRTRHGPPCELHLVQGGGQPTWIEAAVQDGDGRTPWLGTTLDHPPDEPDSTLLPGGVGRWSAMASHAQLLGDPAILDSIAELVGGGRTLGLERGACLSARALRLSPTAAPWPGALDDAGLLTLAVAGSATWPPPPRRPLRLSVAHIPSSPEAPPAGTGFVSPGFLSQREAAREALVELGDRARVSVDAAVAALGPQAGLLAWVEGAILASRSGALRDVCFASRSADLAARLRALLPSMPCCLGLAMEPDEELVIDARASGRGRPWAEPGPASLRLEPAWLASKLRWTEHGLAAGLAARERPIASRERLAEQVRGFPKRSGAELPAQELLPEELLGAWAARDITLLLESEGSSGDDLAAIPWEAVGGTHAAAPGLSRVLVRQLRVGATPAVIPPRARALVIAESRVPGAGDLPFARAEGRAVARLFRLAGLPTTLVERGGYEILRQALADDEGYAIIHVAAHGEVASNNLGLGALLLTDAQGRLRRLLPEAMSVSAAAPGLVFLNACELGTTVDPGPSPEHHTPFARSLIQAGVGAFVGAAWRTRDDAAAAFGEAFYRAILFGRLPFGRALLTGRRASWQRAPEDRTWASFQGYGDPSLHPLPDLRLAETPATWEDWAATLDDLADRIQAGARERVPALAALAALSDEAERPGLELSDSLVEQLARTWMTAQEPARAVALLNGRGTLVRVCAQARAQAALLAWSRLPPRAPLAARAPVQASMQKALATLAQDSSPAGLLLAAEVYWLAAQPGLVPDPGGCIRFTQDTVRRLQAWATRAADPELRLRYERLRSATINPPPPLVPAAPATAPDTRPG